MVWDIMYDGEMHEWRERMVRATAALYRVTNLLPAGEPLRKALRKYAAVALAGYAGEAYGMTRGNARTESSIEALLGFLAVARTLPEVKPENFLVLEREYRALRTARALNMKARAAEVLQEQQEEEVPQTTHADRGLAAREGQFLNRTGMASAKNTTADERQRAILVRLSKTPQAKVSDFYAIFHGVSPKTIQRDLHDLVARNAVKKEGERRWTIYTLA